MKILVSALEASSNLHLGELKKHLDPSVEFTGIFDAKHGMPIFDNNSLAVMGFVDAIKKVPFFLGLQKKLLEAAKDVDKVLLMDSSGFNLPLAKKLKKRYPELEIIYYIMPQAWAWRRYRMKAIEKYCDRLCSILPFECGYYSDKCSYVGHPILDEITEFKSDYESSGTVVFMPGSRRREIENLMPVFKQVRQQLPEKRAVLVVPEFLQGSDIYGDTSGFEICSDAHGVLREAEHAFICSGTATFEAAIIGTPFTLAYIINKLDYKIARTLAHIEYAGLANILLNRFDGTILHSEFFQEEVTAKNLLADYRQTRKQKFAAQSEKLRNYLGHGSSETVARLVTQ